jgi:hypothetical protein
VVKVNPVDLTLIIAGDGEGLTVWAGLKMVHTAKKLLALGKKEIYRANYFSILKKNPILSNFISYKQYFFSFLLKFINKIDINDCNFSEKNRIFCN